MDHSKDIVIDISAGLFDCLTIGWLERDLYYSNPVHEMTYTVSSGTLNPSIPYYTYITIKKLLS